MLFHPHPHPRHLHPATTQLPNAFTMTANTKDVAPANIGEIPKKHKAAVYDKPGTASTKVVEVDTPEPGPGQVLVRLTHSGVCHSDYSIMTNSWAMPAPTPEGQIGGHEGQYHDGVAGHVPCPTQL